MKNAMILCAGILLSFPVVSLCQDKEPAGSLTVIRSGLSASATIPETEYNTPLREQPGSNITQASNATLGNQSVE